MTDYPRDDMARIQRTLHNRLDAIRNNPNYSAKGKQTEMAKAVRQARTERDNLRTTYLAAREARRESLQRSLFGIPGDATPAQVMVMRDSRDRAATIDGPEEAATKLALATQAGDTFMAQAIAMVAANKGWRDVVNTYADRAPAGTRTSLEQLADIPTGTRSNVADTVAFRLREPEELRHYSSDTDIDRIASGATETTPQPAGSQYFTHA